MMQRRSKLMAGTVTTMIAALIFVGPAQASTAEDFQYRAILAEQGGGGNAHGVGGLPFTGVNLVLLGGVGAAATVAGALFRRIARSVQFPDSRCRDVRRDGRMAAIQLWTMALLRRVHESAGVVFTVAFAAF